MDITLRQRGGFLGLDRTINVSHGVLRLVDGGVTRGKRRLPARERQQLYQLAAGLMNVHVSGAESLDPISNSMETVIEIHDQRRRNFITVRSGDSVPHEVWEFVGAAKHAGDQLDTLGL